MPGWIQNRAKLYIIVEERKLYGGWGGNNPEYCYSVSTHVNCQKYRCAMCVILVYVTITGPFMFCTLAAMCCPMHSVQSLCSNVLSCAHSVLSFCGKLCYSVRAVFFPLRQHAFTCTQSAVCCRKCMLFSCTKNVPFMQTFKVFP